MPRKLLTIDVSTEAESAMMIIALSLANCKINVPDNISFHPSLPSFLSSPIRRQAYLCIVAKNCSEAGYLRLVEALCKEHQISLLKVI